MRSLPVLAGLVVVVLWASAFPAIKVASEPLGPVGLSLARLLVASVVLLGAGVAFKLRLPGRRDLGWIVACGLFGMTLYQLLLNWGELFVPAGTASIIVAAAPMVSVLTARLLFGDRLSPITIVGSVIAMGGVVAVCLARAGVSMSSAVWIVVGAMVVQGIYHPLQKPLLARHRPVDVATWTMVAGTVMTLPLLPVDLDRMLTTAAEAWWSALYLGVLPSALGFVLWAYAVARMPVAVSTSFLYLVPPVAVLIAWWWLGERPVVQEVLGGIVVLVGVLVIARGRALLDLWRRRGGAVSSKAGQEQDEPIPGSGESQSGTLNLR